MKRYTICITALLLLTLAACGPKQENVATMPSPEATVTTAPIEALDSAMLAGVLTEDEVKFFNEKFFTTETEYPGRWVRNNILHTEFTTSRLNEYMQRYLGISLEESEKNGLDTFYYNPEYDAYYLMRSDAMGTFVQVKSGERKEDGTVVLVYLRSGQPFAHLKEKELEALPQYQVVLKETETGYQFVSNQLIVQ